MNDYGKNMNDLFAPAMHGMRSFHVVIIAVAAAVAAVVAAAVSVVATNPPVIS
jgi:uncharacterized membrane protein (DUF106 family)